MTEITANELNLSFPEGFREMNDAELTDFKAHKTSRAFYLADPGRHVVVSGGWTKSVFVALLADEEEAAKKAERNIRGPMRAYGYQLEGFSKSEIGGKSASGYRYHYTSRGIEMTGETFVVKNNKVLYYLNLYARTEFLEESLKVWQDILDSAKWA